ncbi:hypothetical protein JL721_1384 [Aureococcus anophagefferens]|nr:hypothetical protein JL721_1384 [Aureococcus anophagefferens]
MGQPLAAPLVPSAMTAKERLNWQNGLRSSPAPAKKNARPSSRRGKAPPLSAYGGLSSARRRRSPSLKSSLHEDAARAAARALRPGTAENRHPMPLDLARTLLDEMWSRATASRGCGTLGTTPKLRATRVNDTWSPYEHALPEKAVQEAMAVLDVRGVTPEHQRWLLQLLLRVEADPLLDWRAKLQRLDRYLVAPIAFAGSPDAYRDWAPHGPWDAADAYSPATKTAVRGGGAARGGGEDARDVAPRRAAAATPRAATAAAATLASVRRELSFDVTTEKPPPRRAVSVRFDPPPPPAVELRPAAAAEPVARVSAEEPLPAAPPPPAPPKRPDAAPPKPAPPKSPYAAPVRSPPRSPPPDVSRLAARRARAAAEARAAPELPAPARSEDLESRRATRDGLERSEELESWRATHDSLDRSEELESWRATHDSVGGELPLTPGQRAIRLLWPDGDASDGRAFDAPWTATEKIASVMRTANASTRRASLGPGFAEPAARRRERKPAAEPPPTGRRGAEDRPPRGAIAVEALVRRGLAVLAYGRKRRAATALACAARLRAAVAAAAR